MLSFLRARLLSWPGVAVVVAVLVLAELVVPRLTRGGGERLTAADRSFARVCRDHGGTPSLAPGSGDYVKDARSCEIRYGADTYEMYAVHPEGFSEREAAVSRRACAAQAGQARRDAEAGGEPATTRFVWHPRSGICEGG